MSSSNQEQGDTDLDPLTILGSQDPETLADAVQRLRHLRNQFRVRYRYLVGEWRGGPKAKDTRNGQFVSKEEVVRYLDGRD